MPQTKDLQVRLNGITERGSGVNENGQPGGRPFKHRRRRRTRVAADTGQVVNKVTKLKDTITKFVNFKEMVELKYTSDFEGETASRGVHGILDRHGGR